MQITTADIKVLRQASGAGIADCRSALIACQGDIGSAAAFLQEAMLKTEHLRHDKPALEGRVFFSRAAGALGGVVLRCETDFSARSSRFLQGGEECAWLVMKCKGNEQEFLSAAEPIVSKMAAVIKEHIELGPFQHVPIMDNEISYCYIHDAGRIVSSVICTGSHSEGIVTPAAEAVLMNLALQAAAAAPLYVSREALPAAAVRRKTEEFGKEFEAMGKHDKLRDVIVSGKLAAYLKSVTLLEQEWIKDPGLTVSRYLAEACREAGIEIVPRKIFRLSVL